MKFEKSGIVRGGIISYINEPIVIINTTNSFYPSSGVKNSCVTFAKVSDLIVGDSYVFSCRLFWNYTDATVNASNFYTRCQGATYNNSTWGWSTGNNIADGINQYIAKTTALTDFIKSNKIYSNRFSMQFSANVTACEVGWRTDYADGSSYVRMTNIEVIPLKYFVGTVNNTDINIGAKILDTNIIADNFIEY